jgi:hypothetical protein
MLTLTLQPDETDGVDCSIASGSSADNPFDSTSLQAGTFVFTGPGIFYRSLLRFSLADLPTSAIVVSAALTLKHASSTVVGTPTFLCRLLERTDWTEAATWNKWDGVNAWTAAGGDIRSMPVDTFTLLTANGDIVFSTLAEAVQFCIDAGRSSADLIWTGPEASGVANFKSVHSSGAADPSNRPQLVINYIDAASILDGLLSQVGSDLAGLCGAGELPGILGANVVDRLVPFAGDIGAAAGKTYKLPAILVFAGANERYAPAMNDSADIGYPVVIAILEGMTNSTAGVNEGRKRFLYWRERIIDQYLSQYLTLSSPAVTFHDCQVEPGPIVDWNKVAEGMRVGSFTLRFVTRKLNRQT